MQYVITGASGHIGNNLVRYINACEPDAEIVVLTRRAVTKELRGATCTQVIGSLSDLQFFNQHIHGDSTVIHLACLMDLQDRDWEAVKRVNFDSTKMLCDLCAQKKIHRFIYVGSVDGIARTGKEAKICEPELFEPDKIEGNYGKTKAMAMQYVWDTMQRNPEFRASILMPSAVIGIHDYKPSAVGKVILDTVRGKPEFGIKGGYNFVDVEDVCRAIFALSHMERFDRYILSGENVTVPELYEAVNRNLGWQKKPILVPFPLVTLCMPFIRVLNKITVKALREPHNYSCEKALRELDLTVTPFEETISKTVRWFCDHRDLFQTKQ